MTITLREKRLLLGSDTITFHLTALYSDSEPGKSALLTTVKGWGRSATGLDNEIVEVSFDRTVVDHYNGHGESLTGYAHIIGGGKYDEFARTWLNTLQKGSHLSARWVRNNASPVLNEIGWVCDELSLATYDPAGRNGKHFKVAKYVGPDNTARMIRVQG